MDTPTVRYWTTSQVDTVGLGASRIEAGVLVEAGSVAQARRAAAAQLRNQYPGARVKVVSAAPAPEKFQ